MIEMLSLAYYVLGQIKDYSLLCQTSFSKHEPTRMLTGVYRPVVLRSAIHTLLERFHIYSAYLYNKLYIWYQILVS